MAFVNTIPLSARKSAPLDLATVERRGHNAPNHLPPKPQRMFGLQEAPTYRPTAEQFKDPIAYMQSIREEAQQYGIVKIVPPDTWNPAFAVDTERFHFKTRRQELNSVEGGMYQPNFVSSNPNLTRARYTTSLASRVSTSAHLICTS